MPCLIALIFLSTLALFGGDRSLPTTAERKALPADGGPAWNRLVFEKSPYLLQHADNPVDWYPWGEEAFARAAEENKPVFLSIGYATCHWCHVMARESFEDEAVAALLNKDFISIKVDREERPDIDKVYMAACQAITGSAGWPLTVFLTPDRKPFFAGTYFPKTTRGQTMGLLDLLPRMTALWTEQRDQAVFQAQTLVDYLAREVTSDPETPDQALLKAGMDELITMVDEDHGGFRGRYKFPQPSRLTFLLRAHQRFDQNERALQIVEKTLEAMQIGGIWDHLGGGFHRYATDQAWRFPHFEKMLYDQALIAIAYLEAYQLSRNASYAQTARQIFAYVERRLSDPNGGFYAAEDAESEQVEGKSYLWAIAEIRDHLKRETADRFIAVYNLTEEGNFREEATGRLTGTNVLYRDADWETLSQRLRQTPENLRKEMASARAILLAARDKRVQPLRDTKILTDWNALMIGALARGARVLEDPALADRAQRAAEFLLENLRDERGRLYKRWAGGEAGLRGMLPDYAFTIWAMLELYEARFDPAYLREAIAFQKQVDARFRDEKGGYFFSPADGETLIMRKKEIFDGAIPSGNAIAAHNLLRLGRITAETEYEERAHTLMSAFGTNARRQPSSHTRYLQAVDFSIGPSLEIVVVGEPERADTRAALEILYRNFIPNKVVLLSSPATKRALTELAPYTETQNQRDGKATVYVCRNFTCLKPITDTEELENQILRTLERTSD